jgi:ketosteroid isomerase-like protein
MYLRLALLALVLPSLACTSSYPGDNATPDPQVSKEVLVASVDSAMHAYLTALTNLDAEGVIGHYANDPEFLGYMDGVPVDYATQSANVRALFGGLESIALDPVDVVVTPLGSDVAIASFTFSEVLTDTAGVATPLKGAVSWVWRHNGAGWAMIHVHAVHYPLDVAETPNG